MLPFVNNQAFSKSIRFGVVSPCGTKLWQVCNWILRCSLAIAATWHKGLKLSVNGHLIQAPTNALRATTAARLQAAMSYIVLFGATYDARCPLTGSQR